MLECPRDYYHRVLLTTSHLLWYIVPGSQRHISIPIRSPFFKAGKWAFKNAEVREGESMGEYPTKK